MISSLELQSKPAKARRNISLSRVFNRDARGPLYKQLIWRNGH